MQFYRSNELGGVFINEDLKPRFQPLMWETIKTELDFYGLPYTMIQDERNLKVHQYQSEILKRKIEAKKMVVDVALSFFQVFLDIVLGKCPCDRFFCSPNFKLELVCTKINQPWTLKFCDSAGVTYDCKELLNLHSQTLKQFIGIFVEKRDTFFREACRCQIERHFKEAFENEQLFLSVGVKISNMGTTVYTSVEVALSERMLVC